MATSMDFTYFNSRPLPHQYQTPVPEEDFRFNRYNHAVSDVSNLISDQGIHPQLQETFNSAFSHFEETFYDPLIQSTRAPSVLPSAISPTFENGPFVSGDDGQIRSSSEDKDNVPPQQNKRKAQNRAAQRAFRERKEKHLKDLETQLATLQKQSMSLDSENERLRKELAKIATENEILRATSGSSLDDDLINSSGLQTHLSLKDSENSDRANFSPLRTMVVDDSSGEPLLTAGQTWDYIQGHEKYKQGLVEVGDVCERMKKMARCHGRGPVFRECDIRQAIDESAVAGGLDEL